MSIGADDPEVRRQYERFMLYVDPPYSQKSVCSVAPGASHETCYTEEKVNEERLQQQLNNVAASTESD
jgi:hypothetical protein